MLFSSEVIRGEWMTIPAGEAQFFPDFEPGATCLLSDPGSDKKMLPKRRMAVSF